MESVVGAIEAMTATFCGLDINLEDNAALRSVVLDLQVAIRPFSVSSQAKKSRMGRNQVAPAVAAKPPGQGRTLAHCLKSPIVECQNGCPVKSIKKIVQCGFCLASATEKHKNILSCEQAKKRGTRLLVKDIQSFMDKELAGSKAMPLLPGLACPRKLVVHSIPTSTKWFVMHQLFCLRWQVPDSTCFDTSNLGVLLITCLGHNWKVLPLNEETNYKRLHGLVVSNPAPTRIAQFSRPWKQKIRIALSQWCDAE
jgi:hypothetical protein